MIIDTNYYYQIYSQEITDEISTLKGRISKYESSRRYFVEQLKQYKEVIDRYCDLTFEQIINSKTTEVTKQYNLCVFSITGRIALSQDDANRITRSIIACNKLIKRGNIRIKKLEDSLVSQEGYRLFLITFNELIADAIIHKGYEYNFLGGISSIFIKRKKRYFKDDKAEGLTTVHNNRVVNWGESNKKKKEIIARGGTPYQAVKDGNFNILSDNGGEKWLVYFEDDYSFWVAWDKVNSRVSNKFLYSFVPTKPLIKNLIKATQDETIVCNYLCN